MEKRKNYLNSAIQFKSSTMIKFKSALIILSLLLLFSCGGKKDKNNQYAPTQANSETKSMDNHPGKALFQLHCSACHQLDGSGVPNMYPPLRESEYVNGDVKWLVSNLVNGRQGPITVKGQVYDNVMPAVDYLTYVRQSFGNNSGEVTPKEVKKLRAEVKGKM